MQSLLCHPPPPCWKECVTGLPKALQTPSRHGKCTFRVLDGLGFLLDLSNLSLQGEIAVRAER